MRSIYRLFIGVSLVFLTAFKYPEANVVHFESVYETSVAVNSIVKDPIRPQRPFVIAVKPVSTDIDLSIIAVIESGGNKRAHVRGADSRGLYQLRIDAWTDSIKGLNKKYDFYNWKHVDRYSAEVADYYFHKRIPEMLRAHKIPVNYQTVIAAWNFGITNLTELYRKDKARWMNKLPKVTRIYIDSYKNLATEKGIL